MNTNMTGMKTLHPCALDESSLSIGRLKISLYKPDVFDYLSIDHDTAFFHCLHSVCWCGSI